MLIATKTKVYTLNGGGVQDAPLPKCRGERVERVAEGPSCSAVALRGGDIVLLTEDGSRTVSTGIADPIESLLILSGDLLLIGTEGPHLYRLSGDTVERVEAFDQLECRDEWYTPWGGPAALRSFADTADGWVYADIHVGSIMRSPDRGASWEPVTPHLNKDVHQVATSPQTDERVYANTARAVYISGDRGQTWGHRANGFSVLYGRAIAVHPQDRDCLLATVSDGPGGNAEGRLFRTQDAGLTWSHVTGGFPETTRGNIDTFHIAFSSNGRAWAVSDKTLYCSDNRGQTWETAWEAPEAITMISCKK
jgi:hypothetical protein